LRGSTIALIRDEANALDLDVLEGIRPLGIGIDLINTMSASL